MKRVLALASPLIAWAPLATLADSPDASFYERAAQGGIAEVHKSYIKGQVKAHQDTIALFRKEIASGQDPDAKAFVKETLPTVRSHLKAINAIASSAGVSK